MPEPIVIKIHSHFTPLEATATAYLITSSISNTNIDNFEMIEIMTLIVSLERMNQFS
jgi:hypothetical protein